MTKKKKKDLQEEIDEVELTEEEERLIRKRLKELGYIIDENE